MLDSVDLTQKLRKSIYKSKRSALQRRLFMLQRACQMAKIPIIIVIEGWDAAGKSAALKVLTQPLDPRAVTIHDIQEPRTYETHMPWLWRYWLKVPAYDEMAIFYHSWYEQVLEERVEAHRLKQELHKAYRDIVNFERTLADDGYVIAKFFFHISKEEQARRFVELQRDPLSNWQVRPDHWERHEKYDDYTVATEEILKRTHTSGAPWTLVAATDAQWARITLLETVIHQLEAALQAQKLPLPKPLSAEVGPVTNDENGTELLS